MRTEGVWPCPKQGDSCPTIKGCFISLFFFFLKKTSLSFMHIIRAYNQTSSHWYFQNGRQGGRPGAGMGCLGSHSGEDSGMMVCRMVGDGSTHLCSLHRP